MSGHGAGWKVVSLEACPPDTLYVNEGEKNTILSLARTFFCSLREEVSYMQDNYVYCGRHIWSRVDLVTHSSWNEWLLLHFSRSWIINLDLQDNRSLSCLLFANSKLFLYQTQSLSLGHQSCQPKKLPDSLNPRENTSKVVHFSKKSLLWQESLLKGCLQLTLNKRVATAKYTWQKLSKAWPL